MKNTIVVLFLVSLLVLPITHADTDIIVFVSKPRPQISEPITTFTISAPKLISPEVGEPKFSIIAQHNSPIRPQIVESNVVLGVPAIQQIMPQVSEQPISTAVTVKSTGFVPPLQQGEIPGIIFAINFHPNFGAGLRFSANIPVRTLPSRPVESRPLSASIRFVDLDRDFDP